jgi:uncharacterized protein
VRVKIDLSQLDTEPLAFDERLSLEPERLGGGTVASVVAVRLGGEVRAHGGVYAVLGRCRAEGALACARCLEPVAWSSDERFSVEYRRATDGGGDPEVGLEEDELEVSFLDGDQLDLEELAVEQVLLALPMRTLCAEDCAGLCPRCGANRNLPDACRCRPEPDPRWQGLAGLAGRESDN